MRLYYFGANALRTVGVGFSFLLGAAATAAAASGDWNPIGGALEKEHVETRSGRDSAFLFVRPKADLA